LKQAQTAAQASGSTAADWTRLGALFADIGRHSDAAEAYGQALKAARSGAGGGREPEWLLWLLHGGALEQADRWNEAKAALEEAYALAPEQPLVLNYLGYAQIERRENIAAASGLITKASNLQPNSPQITDSLGWARYLLGDVNGAVELLERAVQGDPNDPAISEHLGDAYYSAGRHFEARYAWQAALISAEEVDAKRIRAKIDSGLKPELASP
jgi:Flp pilus assembly protein TadD